MKYLKNFESIDWNEDWEEELPVEEILNEEFTKFLINNNIYDKFVNNTRNMDDYLKKMKYDSLYRAVTNAFTWALTPEGRDFWMNYHMKWKKLCGEENRMV